MKTKTFYETVQVFSIRRQMSGNKTEIIRVKISINSVEWDVIRWEVFDS